MIENALNYVVSNVKQIDDLYALSVAAYALQVAEHPSRTEVLDLLIAKSITKGQLNIAFEREVGFQRFAFSRSTQMVEQHIQQAKFTSIEDNQH